MNGLPSALAFGLACLGASLATTSIGAQVGVRGLAQVECDGLACGGGGGSLGADYVYRVDPNGNPVTSFEVGVEDGDVGHYAYRGPAGWRMRIVAGARDHDLDPTEHGAVARKAGACSYVLRFSGPARTQAFDLGFDYVQHGARFHDAHWSTSDGRQAGWSAEVGRHGGPVHSPLRLNVLLIVLDDLGTDKLELFDTPHAPLHAYAKAPRLESLAARGVRFTNFYVNPLCSATRACIQTGRYAFRHGVGTLTSDIGLEDCELTLAELLKLGFDSPGAAYRSGAFGKWHLTPVAELLENVTHPVRNGYERFFGTLSNTLDHYDWRKVEHDAAHLDPVVIDVTGRWSADVVRADAASWIASVEEPFFAYVAFNPPHARFDPPPFMTQDGRSLLSESTREAVLLANPEDRELFYRAMIEAVDAEIGYLLDDIAPATLAKTMVFVVSDNGTPEGLIGPPHPTGTNHGKKSIYQLGIRVPMIVSGPLATTGVCDAAVGAVDLWATIAAITGADPDVAAPVPCPDPARDSVSFLRLIEDPALPAVRPAFSQIFTPNGIVDSASLYCLGQHGRAVTNGSYKYVRKLMQDGNVPPACQACAIPCGYEHELYDLIADPDETTNLYPPPLYLRGLFESFSRYMDSLSEF